MENDEGGADCEGEDEPAGDLVERRIDIFQGVVARTVDDARVLVPALGVMICDAPESDNVQCDHGYQSFADFEV